MHFSGICNTYSTLHRLPEGRWTFEKQTCTCIVYMGHVHIFQNEHISSKPALAFCTDQVYNILGRKKYEILFLEISKPVIHLTRFLQDNGCLALIKSTFYKHTLCS